MALYNENSDTAYARALRMGQKYVRSADDEKNAYLPALADKVAELNGLPRVPLGVKSIPVDRIVGSEMPGRTTAFAGNFMPLMEVNSEFYSKWRLLYESVLDEGVKEPPRVVEYMHRYYAIEGNKRISVMKLLGSDMMEADVTRIYPARSEEKEVKVYYEYLDFYVDSRLMDVDCTEPGSYSALIELSGHTPGVRWSQEDTDAFTSSYNLFLSAYRQLNHQMIHVTTGDVLLLYIQAFGYDQFIKDTTSTVRKNLERLRSEVVAQSDETITMKLSTDGQDPGFFHRLLHLGGGPVKVCFISNRSPEQSGWIYWHALGRNHVDEVFKGQVITQMMNDVAASDCEEAVRTAAQNGARVIFTTSPVMLEGALRAAMDLPDVKVLNCSLRPMYKTVRSYYLRLYEAKFVLGAIAGAVAADGRIGYIADYPVFGLPASVNAFALGARFINPRAKVYLDWANLIDHDPEQALADRGVHVISNRDIAAPAFESQEFGLYEEHDGERTRLAMPVWNWGKMYEAILRRIANGQWDTDTQGGASVMNYWWGMDSGAIDVFYSSKLDPGTRRMVDLLHDLVRDGKLFPFSGEIRDQEGNLRCAADASLSPAELVSMNWLCDNVEGAFPALEQLVPKAVDFVRRQGVLEAAAPDVNEIRIEQGKN